MQKRKLNVEQAISYKLLRQSMGYIGLCLPVYLLDYSAITGQAIEPSISDYYYSGASVVFTGSLAIIGCFLILYQGHVNDIEHGIAPRWTDWFSDRWVATLGGLGALGTAIFPLRTPSLGGTACGDTPGDIAGIILPVSSAHFISATVFLLMTAIFCLFLFTRGNGARENTYQKNGMKYRRIAWTGRNKFFATCGVIILGCIFALAAIKYFEDSPFVMTYLSSWNAFFWIEVAAVMTFAQAWLKKRQINSVDRPSFKTGLVVNVVVPDFHLTCW